MNFIDPCVIVKLFIRCTDWKSWYNLSMISKTFNQASWMKESRRTKQKLISIHMSLLNHSTMYHLVNNDSYEEQLSLSYDFIKRNQFTKRDTKRYVRKSGCITISEAIDAGVLSLSLTMKLKSALNTYRVTLDDVRKHLCKLIDYKNNLFSVFKSKDIVVSDVLDDVESGKSLIVSNINDSNVVRGLLSNPNLCMNDLRRLVKLGAKLDDSISKCLLVPNKITVYDILESYDFGFNLSRMREDLISSIHLVLKDMHEVNYPGYNDIEFERVDYCDFTYDDFITLVPVGDYNPLKGTRQKIHNIHRFLSTGKYDMNTLKSILSSPSYSHLDQDLLYQSACVNKYLNIFDLAEYRFNASLLDNPNVTIQFIRKYKDRFRQHYHLGDNKNISIHEILSNRDIEWDNVSVSKREDVTIDIVKNNMWFSWCTHNLLNNPSIFIEDILSNPNIPWFRI